MKVPPMTSRDVSLKVTGFDELGTILRTVHARSTTFLLPSVELAMKMGVCLVHLNSVILSSLFFVQEGKAAFNLGNPEPQVIVEPIATFQHNNRKRSDLDPQ